MEFQKLYDPLWRDEARNQMICADVLAALREGRSPLVLTERTEHLEILAERPIQEGSNVITLRGGMGRKALQAALDKVASGSQPEVRSAAQSRAPLAPSSRVILATSRFIGEGFDDPRLDTLFLALPVSWRGTVAQYVGRLHRLHEGKRAVRVYDYADLNVTMLTCSTGVVAATNRWVTPCCCRAGRSKCHCRLSRNGNKTMPPACAG